MLGRTIIRGGLHKSTRGLVVMKAGNGSTSPAASASAAATTAPPPLAAAAAPSSNNNGGDDPPSSSASHERVQQLAATDDAYGGVIVDASALPADAGAFGAALDASIARWLASGKRGVWLKLPLASAALVPTAAARGFDFHHAERGHVMMTRWLPRDAQSTLPPNASHQVGVGAFVVNGRGEVLVVQEANGPLKGKGVYKMPTGLVHAGEDIIDAAVREVAEETGIVATPDAVIAVRQAHNFAFGKSDAFFCVGMRAAGDQEPRPCEVEVAEARWMPLAEYAKVAVRGAPLYETLLDRCVAWAEGRYKGWRADRLEAGLWGRQRVDVLLYGSDDGGGGGGGGGG